MKILKGILIILGIVVAVSALFVIRDKTSDSYKYRYRECSVEELRNKLKNKHNFLIPDNILNAKAAKTPKYGRDGGVEFILKFELDVNSVNEMLKQFPEDGVLIDDYSVEEEKRSYYFRPPDWFTSKINKGQYYNSPPLKMYIDISPSSNRVVYIWGGYRDI